MHVHEYQLEQYKQIIPSPTGTPTWMSAVEQCMEQLPRVPGRGGINTGGSFYFIPSPQPSPGGRGSKWDSSGSDPIDCRLQTRLRQPKSSCITAGSSRKQTRLRQAQHPTDSNANQHGVYTSYTRTFRYPYQHPQNVFYIFVHEDGRISQLVTGRADDVIYLPPMAA